MTTLTLTLRCLSCRRTFDIPPVRFDCPSCTSGLLTVAQGTVPHGAGTGPAGIWRHASALPAVTEGVRVSLGEGGTPMVAMRSGGHRFWVKNEGVGPTASYKDRFNAVNVSVARALGFSGLTLASTGNAGLSAASYGARARLSVRVYCPPETPAAMRWGIEATGARLDVCPAGRARELVARDVAEGYFPGSRAVPAVDATPFGAQGYKTISYELVEFLGEPPGSVYLPVGGGDGLYGVHEGFRDLVRNGLVDRLPRLVGVRTRDPSALSICTDEVGEHARAAVRESGGRFVDVTGEQVRAAVAALGAEGLSAEPASAAALAGLLVDQPPAGRGRDVCVLTGAGVKWAELSASLAAPVNCGRSR